MKNLLDLRNESFIYEGMDIDKLPKEYLANLTKNILKQREDILAEFIGMKMLLRVNKIDFKSDFTF